MLLNLCTLFLTAFISVNGQVVEVPAESVEYEYYIGEVVTVGEEVVLPTSSPNPPENVESTVEPYATESPVPTEVPSSVVSGDGVVTYAETGNGEEVVLLQSIEKSVVDNTDVLMDLLESQKSSRWLFVFVSVVCVLILRRK